MATVLLQPVGLMAVTDADKLLAAIQETGIQATLSKPHVCSEEDEKK